MLHVSKYRLGACVVLGGVGYGQKVERDPGDILYIEQYAIRTSSHYYKR